MKKIILPLALLSLFIGKLPAQSPPSSPPPSLWRTLAKVTFEKQYDELMGFKVDVPVFGDEVKDLDGEIVEVSGYIVPVEGYRGHTEFVFSAYPYNMCFFCGGAGPETVMEVTATDPIEYTVEKITIRGQLLLNDDNINRLMYIMVDAEEVLD